MINRIYILIPFIFIAFVLVSCAGHQAERETVEVPPVPVITQKPERGSVTDWYRTTCELRSPLEATLSFATGGRIIELTANVGDRVKRGQYLGRVDTSTLAAQHSAALIAA
ncbi:MAG TPA: hypothetical protein ENN67_05695, partial [Firmicutes bacterium]|nr:hypothetical protein [Bacillota bacterium]